MTPQPRSKSLPLESLDFLPARLGETFAFIHGVLPLDQYPKWVQRVGAELAQQLLPSEWLKSAQDQVEAFSGGFSVGMLMSSDGARTMNEMRPDEIAHLQRVGATGVQLVGGPLNVAKTLKEFTSKKMSNAVKKAVRDAVVMAPAGRLAFFRGLTLGLDFNSALEAAVSSIAKRIDRDTMYLRVYLWLRWPEFEELDSLPHAYLKCRKAFGTIRRANIVGSEPGFRRFCNRIGLTYRTKQRAKREGQKRRSNLSRDKADC